MQLCKLEKKMRKAFGKKAKTAFSVISIILTLVVSIIPSQKVNATEEWPEGISVGAEAAIVMDQTTGTILYEKNIHEQLYPASITKVMTALLAIENCEMDEIVTFSPESIYNIEVGSSSIARDVDEQMTMEQCLYGLMLESANECAYAIAEHVGWKYGEDGYETFINMMNEKAKELGCTDSHFCNPHGLPEDDHYVSAYDMALIAQAALQHNEFVKIISTRHYTIPPTNKHSMETNLNNQHGMFSSWRTTQYLYDYCIGGKTGYTDLARHTLVTYARKDGMTLVCVVLKCEGQTHYVDTTNLLEYCYNNFGLVQLPQDNEVLSGGNSNADVGVLSERIDLVKPEADSIIVLPTSANVSDVEYEITSMSDPEDENVVGQITYKYADREVGATKLIYTDTPINTYPFSNDEYEEGEEPYKIIDLWSIIRIVLIVLAVVVVVFLIIKLFPKAQEKAYRFLNSRKRNPHHNLKKIDRSKRRRRRR